MTANKVVMELKGFRLGDYPVPKDEDFTVDKAHQLLDAHIKKRDGRHEKIKLKVYSDHIRVTKGSFFADVKQDHYHLDNIHRFFVFKNDPQLLILGILNHGKKAFILLHFKTPSQTNMLCDHIEKVKGPSKQYTQPIDEETEMTQNQQLETFVVNEESEVRHVDHVVVCERPPTPPREIDSEIVDEIRPDYTTTVETVRMTSNGYYENEVAIYPPDYDNEPRHYNHQPERIDNELLHADTNGGNWKEDMQYIDYSPKYGSVVTENGPIYMYTANQIVPEYRGYSVCVSSSSSSSEDDDDDHKRRQGDLKDHPVVYENDDHMYAGASFEGPSVSAEVNGGNDHYGMRY